MTLHIISRSPFDCPYLIDCIDVLQPDDAVLLVDDGIYGLLHPALQSSNWNVHFLAPDAKIRGIEVAPHLSAQSIDFDQMVRLTESYNPICSWG